MSVSECTYRQASYRHAFCISKLLYYAQRFHAYTAADLLHISTLRLHWIAGLVMCISMHHLNLYGKIPRCSCSPTWGWAYHPHRWCRGSSGRRLTLSGCSSRCCLTRGVATPCKQILPTVLSCQNVWDGLHYSYESCWQGQQKIQPVLDEQYFTLSLLALPSFPPDLILPFWTEPGSAAE